MKELLSIIIPTLNEQATIVETLQALQPLRQVGHEIIVVDGGSVDNTQNLASSLADSVLLADKGRALQMNTGAKFSHNEILLFLHADTRLSEHADQLIITKKNPKLKLWTPKKTQS